MPGETGHKQEAVHEELRESRRRLEQAQALAALGSWEWDLAADRVTWSPEMWRIAGLEPRESIGFEQFAAIVHPDDRDFVRDVVGQAREEAREFEYRARILRPDGSTRVIHARGETRADARGTPVLMLGTAQDVTEQTLREERLLQAEERLRLLVERIPAVTYTAEPGADGAWLWVSPQIQPLLGYSPEEWVSDPSLWLERMHPDDRDRVLTQEESAAAAGGHLAVEYRMRARDGRMLWVRDEGAVVPGTAGRSLLEGVLTDITERKLAEEALRSSERRYRTIVETTTEGVWMIAPDGHTVFANRRLAELLGESADALEGRPFWDFMTEETLEQVKEMRRESRRGPLEGELELRAADGRRLWVHGNTAPIFEDGEYRGQLALVTDITTRRQADEERVRLEKRLRQHERMESVGQLAGGIAHDFNNLLAVILTYANFASDQLEGHPAKDDIDEIGRAAERAAALTRQLLVFSRRELAQPEVLDLNEVVEDTRSMLQRTLGEDVRLELRPARPLWALKADRGQLEQVIVNLAINARDSMLRGGTITVETANVHLDEAFGDVEPGPYVRLAVTDTGAGMPPEVAARVFEPFFTTKPTGEGTGLGLSTVYGIVKQAGGRIDVYSEQGVGTVFKVYLPATLERARVEAQIEPDDQVRRGRGETILMVEDEEAVRKAVRRVLTSAGYVVLEAATPYAALATFGHLGGQVDLLLTDVVMPGMSGTELASRLRDKLPDLRVLFASGYTDDVVMRHGVEQERFAFIEKPFSPERLQRKVRDVLDGAPVA